jgi:23S rRNA U2552 (ribose-2'-O)-methylase RlmE/FtsJ
MLVGTNKACLILALSPSIQVVAALIATTSSRNNVVFVGGLSEDLSSTKQLSKEFDRYGAVVDVSIINSGGKQQPYAFVQFESSESAQAAIETAESSLYRQVKAAQPIDRSKRKRSNESRQQREAELQHLKDVCSRTSLILQTQATHVDRLNEFLTNYLSKKESIDLTIEGSSKSPSKNISLVFVSTSDPIALSMALSKSETLTFIARAVNKLYIVQPGAIQTDMSKEEGCDIVVQDLIQNKIASCDDLESVRLQIFPPSCQRKVIAAIEALDDNGLAAKLNPRDATETISLVQVYKHKGKGSDTSTDALAMCGVSRSIIDYSIYRENPKIANEGISRAYYKIKEAVSRYESEREGFSMEKYRDYTAIDCGSAPGGWTKYLAKDAKMKIVHSVDPGDLDPTIEIDNNVNHMRMKIQEAIPCLKSQIEHDEDKIKVFVSDACLHSMSAQADFLLDAKDQGILADEVFFVLTLKCTIGHGKANFDAQVAQTVSNLKEKAAIRDLSVYHLFSNRIGERTIIGKLI